jgi:hypothetical protein
MNKINLGRLFIGGLIATVLLFITDGFLHERIVHDYWTYLYQGLNATPPQESHGSALLYFLVFEIGRGFTAVLMYVLMRPFSGAGAKTAVLAAVAAWFAFSLTGPAQFIPLGFYGRHLWALVAGYQLVTSVIANLIAAWMYRDPATAASPAE